MPREQVVLRDFHKGMVPNVDGMDVDIQTAFWCNNVDLLNREGQLSGLPGDENKTSTIGALGNIQGHAMIQKSDRTYTFIGYDATADDIKQITDFYGTPSGPTSIDTDFTNSAYCAMVTRNNSVRVARYNATNKYPDAPVWYGYTNNSVFGQTSTDLLGYDAGREEAEVATREGSSSGNFNISTITSGAADTDGYFRAGKTYYWAYALEYDGYQLSPLAYNSNLENIILIASTASVQVRFNAIGANHGTYVKQFPKRITALYIFRAEGSNSRNGYPDTEYRYVTKIGVSTGWSNDGDNKYYTYTDTGDEGATYESLAGIPQTATVTMPNYRLIAECNGYLFAGDNYVASIEDAPTMIFRSLAGRFDVFPVQSFNFVKLPNIPTAMTSFNNTLIVFDYANMYRINPDSLAIEETIAGYGCFGPQSIYTNMSGIYFANTTGIYYYDGKTIGLISKAINEYVDTVTYNTGSGDSTITDYSYRTIVASVSSTNPIKLVFDAKQDMLLAAVSVSGVTVMYGFSVRSGAWTMVDPPNTAAGSSFSFFNGKDSETYMPYRASSTNYLYKLISDYSTKKIWTWISHRINFTGDEDQYQKWYGFHAVESASNTRYYGINNGTLNVNANGTGEIITAGNRRNYNFRLFLRAGAAGRVIYSITLVYRKLRGIRHL